MVQSNRPSPNRQSSARPEPELPPAELMTDADILSTMRTLLFRAYVRPDGRFEFYNIFEHGTCKRQRLVLSEEQMLYAGHKLGARYTSAPGVVGLFSLMNPELFEDDSRSLAELRAVFSLSADTCCICSCSRCAKVLWIAARSPQ